MKTEVKKVEEVKGELPFPKLMISEDLIVIFSECKKGIVVSVNSKFYPIGYFSNDWSMDVFKDLPSDQQVILQNH